LASVTAINFDKNPEWHVFALAIAGIMLLVAAMTSFYMFRLYLLVFSGESRADAQTQHHIHESPAVMTVPLCVLAVLSVFGGLVGTPFADRLGGFLAEPEVHIPWLNMGLGTFAFLCGLFFAWTCYAGGVREPVRKFVSAMPGLYKLVKNKY